MTNFIRCFLILIGLFFCEWVSFAQPGGGGGLNISHITYLNGDTLDFSDKNFKINHFVMNEKFDKIKYQFTDAHSKKINFATGQKEWFFLPPNYTDDKVKTCPYQRLDIIYKIDTMRIDFYGVCQENGKGHTEQLTKIEFFPGKYKFHLTESERFDSCWQYRVQFADPIKKLREDMRTGITNQTKQNLKSWRILEEEFNPFVEIIWARFNRENCLETNVQSPTNFYRLCECMMTLTQTHLYIKTNQKKVSLNDTMGYQFYFYHVFKKYSNEIYLDKNSRMHMMLHPVEENRIAQKYLDALDTNTVYINDAGYTGKIVLNILVHSQYNNALNSGNEQFIYYYVDGKLKQKIKAVPPFGPSIDVRD
jgi:hypothetical protein